MSKNPLLPNSKPSSDDAAVNLIRSKVSRAYGQEPNATEELAEVKHEKVLSKHQHYMQELSASGKSLADIQTEWHRYYLQLSDAEKHEVWQEFYAANQHTPYQKLFQKQQEVHLRKRDDAPAQSVNAAAPVPVVGPSGVTVAMHEAPRPKRNKALTESAAAKKFKAKMDSPVTANGKLTLRHHIQSLAFGLASGLIVLIVLLFTFFNEYIIAPLVQPGRKVSNAPIILSDDTTNLNAPPAVTIPKINVQIPLDFNVQTLNEDDIEAGLKTGVVHYATTSLPGQNGNAAYFGHSAVNIFNNGEKYGFAFTLLHNLTTGDVFYITYNGKTYAYRIFQRQVVPPSDVGVIHDTEGKQATATLITCDPPGVSTNRLVMWGEQISPAISTNTNPTSDTTAAATTTPAALAGNGPTLFSRLINTLEFWK